VGYDTFLHHALGRTGPGARELDGMSSAELVALSAGTGVPIERLRAMMTGATMARMSERIREWLLTKEGQAALDQLRVSLMRTIRQAEAGSRDRERRHAISEQAGLRCIDGSTAYVTS